MPSTPEAGLLARPSAWRTVLGVLRQGVLPKRLRRHRAGMVGLAITSAFILISLFGPFLAPYDPVKINISARLETPSAQYILGTDELGRDILSRLLTGARITLGVSTLAVAIGLVVGTALGVTAGYFRGKIDMAVVFMTSVLLAMPGFLLAMALVAILGVGLQNVAFGVAVWMVPQFALLSRGATLAVREMDHVLAARSLGARHLRILLVHVLPSAFAPLTVLTTLRLASAILTVSGLSFLGLGAQPPTPEWGYMIATAREFIFAAPYAIFFPGLAIMLSVYGFNLLGDGLRDTLDPRLRGTT